MFLNKNKIKDKIVRREFLKICRNRGKYLRYNDILKEAMEVASYYNENQIYIVLTFIYKHGKIKLHKGENK